MVVLLQLHGSFGESECHECVVASESFDVLGSDDLDKRRLKQTLYDSQIHLCIIYNKHPGIRCLENRLILLHTLYRPLIHL